jgi:hypothetical protein
MLSFTDIACCHPQDMGALSVLSLKKNNLCNREAGKALSEMLVVNTVLTELDVSENKYYKCDSAGFAQELAVGIIDNGVISHFTFSGDGGRGNTPVTMEISMTEVDFSAKGLGKSGVVMVAAFLPKCTYVDIPSCHQLTSPPTIGP